MYSVVYMYGICANLFESEQRTEDIRSHSLLCSLRIGCFPQLGARLEASKP